MVSKRVDEANRKVPYQPREVATLSQTLKIVDFVREHCRLDETSGYALWDTGWSDESVAAAVGLEGSARVKKVRRELVGDLPGRTSKTDAQRRMQDQIDDLARMVGELSAAVTKIEAQHKVLVAFANKMQNGGS